MEAGVSVWIRRVFGHQPAKVLVSRPKKPHGPHPDGPLLIALEPRYLFDGAAAATTAGIVHQVDHPGPAPQGPDPLAEALANHVLPVDPTANVSAPVEVRALDAAQNGSRKEVVFVDTATPGYQALADGVRAGVEVDIIDGGQSGLAQLAKWAESHTGYDAIHLITHGSEATLNLGTDRVTNDNLTTAVQQVEWAEIGHALNAGGDVLLYGCDVAKGSDGQHLIAGIATVTGHDVAASTDRTGAAAMGGNWIFETQVGSIEAPVALTEAARDAYNRVLAPAHAAPTAEDLALIPDVSAPTLLRAADPAQDGGKREAVFIDSSVTDYQTLVDGVRAGVEIDLIDGGKSGLAQIAVWAKTHSGYDAIHVLSHGSEAVLYLGIDTLTDAALADPVRQAELAEIGSALNAGGDFLLYGCDIAKGADGQRFLQDIATDTGLDVAASTNVTGAAALGGDWVLERTAGVVDTAALDLPDYQAILPPNSTPVIGNLDGDSVAWAGVGNYVTLDTATALTVADAEFGALNSGSGDWNGATLTIRRVTGAGSADGTTKDLFKFINNNMFDLQGDGSIAYTNYPEQSIEAAQAAGQNATGVLNDSALTGWFARWSYTNATGTLVVQFGSLASGNGDVGQASTTALVQAVLSNIAYRNDTPYGNAIIRFSLSDGTSSTNADVKVTSTTITVDRADDDSGNDAADGFSLREALAQSVAQATADTITLNSLPSATTITLGSTATLGAGDKISFTGGSGTARTIDASSGKLALAGAGSLDVGNGKTLTVSASISGSNSLTKFGLGTVVLSGGSNLEAGFATTVRAGTLSVGGSETVSSGVITLNGGSLTITGNDSFSNEIHLTSAGTITATGSAELAGALTGSGTLTKAGAGTLSLTNTDNHLMTGGLTVSEGEAIVNSDDQLVGGAVTLAAGTTLRVADATTIDNAVALSGAATIEISDDMSVTLSGALSGGAHLLTKTGGGTLTLTNTANEAGLTGGITVSAGALSVADDNALVGGTVTLSVDGNVTFHVTGSTTIDNAVTLSESAAIDVGGSLAVTFSGGISGSYSLEKIGTGTLTLSNTNTYSWTTQVSAGTLTASGGSAISNSSGVYVASGAVFALSDDETVGSLSGAGTVTLGSHTLTTGGNGGNPTFSGAINGTGGLTKVGTGRLTLSGNNGFTGATTVSAGTLQLSRSGGTLADTTAVTVASGATLRLQVVDDAIGSLAGAGTVTLNGGSLTVGGDNSSTTFSGVIEDGSNSGGLTKTGSGTFTLSGPNTYSGITAINGGSLQIVGSTHALSSVVVASGGTLGGSGTVNGSAVVNFGGTLAPGVVGVNNGVGTLTLAGGLTLNGTLAVEMAGFATAGTDYDKVAGTGGVTLGGSSAVTVAGVNGFTPGGSHTYVVIANDLTDAISGTLNGVAEGGWRSSNGIAVSVSYHGGTGNDLSLVDNMAPSFIGGAALSLSPNASASSIAGLLHVSDTDSGQTLTWTIGSAASHGTVSLTGGTTSPTGSTDKTPGGILTYTPTAGYTGTDSFTIQVSDGSTTAIRTISVTVSVPAPPPAPSSDSGGSSSTTTPVTPPTSTATQTVASTPAPQPAPVPTPVPTPVVADASVSVLAATPTSSSPASRSDGGGGLLSTSSSSVSVGGTTTNASTSDGHRSITADNGGAGGSTAGASGTGSHLLSIGNLGGAGSASAGAVGSGNQVLTVGNMGGAPSGGSLGGGGSFSVSSSGSFSSSGGSGFSGAGGSFSSNGGSSGFNTGPGASGLGGNGTTGGTTGTPRSGERDQTQGQGADRNRSQTPDQQNQSRNQTPEQQNQTRNQGLNPGQGQGTDRGANRGGEPVAPPATGSEPAPDATTPVPNLGPRTFLFDEPATQTGPLSFTEQLAAADSFKVGCADLAQAFPGESVSASDFQWAA